MVYTGKLPEYPFSRPYRTGTCGYDIPTGEPVGYIFSLAMDLEWVLVMCLFVNYVSAVPMGLGIVACLPTDKSVGYIEYPYGTVS